MNDVIEQIRAVSRSVGSEQLEVGSARTITLAQHFDAPVDRVWQTCTTLEGIPRWFLPIAGDLELDGRYQLEGNAGGRILTCDPPHGFTAGWQYGNDDSTIEVTFTEDSGGTLVQLVHAAEIDEDLWTRYGPGAGGIGWDMTFLGLATYLRTGRPVSPAESARWARSNDGRQFVAGSSDAWREASVASGTPKKAARQAADRATIAYTTIEE